MDDGPLDPTFIRKPAARGAVRCPHCQAAVPLPPTNPWLAIAGMEFAPTLAAFPCPECDEMIDVASAVNMDPPAE